MVICFSNRLRIGRLLLRSFQVFIKNHGNISKKKTSRFGNVKSVGRFNQKAVTLKR